VKPQAFIIIMACILSCAGLYADDNLEKAYSLYNKGRYFEAVTLTDELARLHPGDGGTAALRIELAIMLGRNGQAQKLYDKLGTKARSLDSVRFAYAKLLQTRGRYEEAEKEYRACLKGRPDDIRALGALGRVLWLSGRKADSLRVLKRLKRLLKKESRLEKSSWTGVDLTQAGGALGLYSLIAPEPELADYALNSVIAAAVKKSPKYPDAHIQSAKLLSSRYNFGEAEGDYKRALKISPENSDALAGLARLNMERYRFNKARELARKALITNPGHPLAYLVLGDYELTGMRIRDALVKYDLALKVNPRLTEGLGRKIACLEILERSKKAADARRLLRSGKELKARALLVEGKVYLDLRRFDMARRTFEEALECDRNWAECSRMLGLCQMLAGLEDKAYVNLERSHNLDPYNRKTYNLLEVSDWMRENLVERRFGRVRLKVTNTDDEILGRLAAREIEADFEELKGIYKLATNDVLVEIFPDHRSFSMRTSGQTWIATVGACTGPVVAVFSPRKKMEMGLNWRRILRHEMTHAVMVVGTRYRVPIWFTEGCAVYEESHRAKLRPVKWLEILGRRLRRGKLIPVNRLNSAFVRPDTMAERQLAYFQSLLAIEMIVGMKGFDAVVAACGDFAEGLDTARVLEKRLGMTTAQFDEKLESYARETLGETIILGGYERRDYIKAKHNFEQNPGDEQARFEYVIALAGYSRSSSPSPEDVGKAVELARGLAAKDKYSKPATKALGWLCLRGGRLAEARKAFEKFTDTKKDPESLVGLARVKSLRGAKKRALELLSLAKENVSLEPAILLWASTTASKAGMTEESMNWLKAYLDTGIDNYRASLRYGRYAIKKNKYRESIRHFQQALSLDPFSIDAYIGLGEALGGVKDGKQGAFYLELALKIEPDDPTAAALLARAYMMEKRKEEAVKMARKAVENGADPETLKDIIED